MKKILLLFAFAMCFFMLSNAQVPYEVISKSSLNVRSYNSTDATILGSLPNGTIVDVYNINGSWAKIKYKGKYAYVNAKYLKKHNVSTSVNNVQEHTIKTTTSSTTSSKEDNGKKSSKKINLDKYASYDVKWLAYVILALSVILRGIRSSRKDEYKPLSQGGYVINLVIFSLTCILELIYFIRMGDNGIWFCMPDEVEWFWAIIGFIVLGFVAYNQISCFFDVINDLRYEADDFDIRLGIYSWIIAVIAIIIVGIGEWEEYLKWIFIVLGICQLIQVILIIVNVTVFGGLFYAIVAPLVYLIGSMATLWLVVQFVALLLMILIVLFFASALLSGKGSSSSSSGGSDRGELTDEYGHHISGDYSSYDSSVFYGDDGKTYYKEPSGDRWKDGRW